MRDCGPMIGHVDREAGLVFQVEGKEPMRKTIAMLGLFATMAVGGCHHVGGKCDCAPQPGDATLYAPFNKEPAPLAGTYEPINAPANAKEMPNGR